MTLQYARLFQLRAGVQLISDHGGLTKEELTEDLRKRKALGKDQEKTEAADDIIEQLRGANLIIKTDGEYRLSSESDFSDDINTVLLYSGTEVIGAGDERAQADRILANIMYEHPMLLLLSKFIYRNSPVKDYALKREFDGKSFLEDKMNQFTIDMGIKLLEDAGVIEPTDSGYIQGRWPIRLFAHIVHEEYQEMSGNSGSVREPELFERLEMLYGISRSAFESYLSRLHSDGIVSEGSYEELILNKEILDEANIHE